MDATTQIDTSVPLYFRFYLPSTGAPYAPTPAPTVTVYRVNEADGTRTALVAALTALTAISGLTGAYVYVLDDSLNDELGQLVGEAVTTDAALTPYPEYATRTYIAQVEPFTFSGEKVNSYIEDSAILAAINAKTNTIGTGSGTVVTAVPSATQLVLVAGDDYLAIDSRALDFTYSGYPDFTGASSVKLRITPINSPGILKLTLTGSVLSSTSLRFEATRTQTATLDQSPLSFEVEVTLADGSVITPTALSFGKVTVYPQASTS